MRIPDVVSDTGTVAYEVKMGDGQWSQRLQGQIDKDLAVIADTTNSVDSIVWHFAPSAGGNALGPNRHLLAALEDAGIEYVIWLP